MPSARTRGPLTADKQTGQPPSVGQFTLRYDFFGAQRAGALASVTALKRGRRSTKPMIAERQQMREAHLLGVPTSFVSAPASSGGLRLGLAPPCELIRPRRPRRYPS